jgi:hypothetical protein
MDEMKRTFYLSVFTIICFCYLDLGFLCDIYITLPGAEYTLRKTDSQSHVLLVHERSLPLSERPLESSAHREYMIHGPTTFTQSLYLSSEPLPALLPK